MPRESYEELLTPLNEGSVIDMENKEVEYDGKNMEAVVILLEFLNKRLDIVSWQFLYFFQGQFTMTSGTACCLLSPSNPTWLAT